MPSRVSKFAWAVLAYNQCVIVFGAFVRATGSGAGCGSHWPLCNGEVIPRAPRTATLIEYTHRATSGLTLLLIVALLIWVWRVTRSGNPLRWTSAFALLFVLTEALIGAWLVLYGLVTTDDSVARALFMMVHLVNTFLLLAFLALTSWWASTGVPGRAGGDSAGMWFLGFAFLATLFLGASGAVTALGDTLFPPATLADAFRQDLSTAAHYLVRLRVYHPFIAAVTAMYLAVVSLWVKRRYPQRSVQALTNGLLVLFAIQIVFGAINVTLLAPVWMQLLHLLVSTLVWIVLVLLGASVFGRSSFPEDDTGDTAHLVQSAG